MKINVIGLGHAGLPTAILLANEENTVIGSDLNVDLVASLKNESFKISDEKINQHYFHSINKFLFFDSKPCSADIHIIAVPTPFIESTKKVELSIIYNVIDQLILLNQEELLIVIESTISPGTINHLKNKYNHINKRIVFAHSPERVMPGNTYNELVNNNRTIGTDDIVTYKMIESLYKSFVKGNIIHTDVLSAELSKVLENTYRDVNIAFANEVAIICRKLNLDVNKVIQVANDHPRVNILNPGPGVGGHCIPVDPWFLVGDFPEDTKLIRAAREVNDKMPEYVKSRILDIVESNQIQLSEVGLYGLTYKANVKDFRESPSIKILDIFKSNLDLELHSFDPFNYGEEEIDIAFNSFINKIKLIVVLVDHSHLIQNLESIKDKIIFDTKNAVNLEKVFRL